MIKLDQISPSITYTAPSQAELVSVPHLIVLVPADIDHSAATRRIWELANATHRNVQLLGLSREAAEESALRRELITMVSLLQEGRINAEAKVNSGTSWLDLVGTYYAADDMLVCFAEQRTGVLRRPLSQMLESNFNATVYVISGLTPQTVKPNRLLQVLAWLGSIAIIIGFGALQAKLIELPEGWTQSVLMLLSIIPEFWLIWFWNSLFG